MIKYPLYVTIDTNIFEENKFNFGVESTMGLLLKYVENNKIKLVLSDIVIKEVKKHISLRVDDACRKVKKLNKEFNVIFPKKYYVDMNMESFCHIPNVTFAEKKAIEIFERFLESCKVEIMGCETIDLKNVIDDYFEIRLPFENNEKKRKEFPDAFIVSEINSRFNGNDKVAIISKDKGFISACKDNQNYIFFKSVNELYDFINSEEEVYKIAVECLKLNSDSIIEKVDFVIDNKCLEIRGLSYDKDGIVDGYDYEDFDLLNYNLKEILLHTIDDINDDIITASFWILGSFNVKCSYKDLDNAVYDSEEKNYIFCETKDILESHNARFACRVEFNISTNAVKILPFKIILGGDSRVSREEINGD